MVKQEAKLQKCNEKIHKVKMRCTYCCEVQMRCCQKSAQCRVKSAGFKITCNKIAVIVVILSVRVSLLKNTSADLS